MKKAFFPILVLVLGVICGCGKTIEFGDEDYDKSAESLVDYTADADKITLTGRATVNYWLDASGNPQDWNRDGIINREDVAVASGVLPGEIKVSNLGSLPLELPYTLSFTLQFTRTDQSRFDAWYIGE